MAVYLGSNQVGETRAIDTGKKLNDFIENGISGVYENSEVTRIASYAFTYTSIAAANFPNVTMVGGNAFANCLSLSQMNLPAATTINGFAFQNCSSLSQINLPAATTIGISTFRNCSSLSQVSLPAVTKIQIYAFQGCSSLSRVYVLGSSICSLSAANAFYSTPIQQSSYLGTFGSIYVPASLYSSYKTATNWTAYRSRFVSV